MSFSGLEPDVVFGHAAELGKFAEQFVSTADRITAILAGVDSQELGGGPEGVLTNMSGSSEELGALLVDKAAAMLAAASGLEFGTMDPLAQLGGGGSIGAGDPGIVGTIMSEVLDFLLGDTVRLWDNGGNDAAQIGRSVAKGFFILRTATWLRLGATGRAALAMQKFPVFNTGFAGRGAIHLANRLGATRLGAFLAEPVIASDVAAISRATFQGGPSAMLRATTATKLFRGLGIAGSAFSTGVGIYDLVQQGNPVEAFKADPSGYASDVAGTAFSASTTAFLVAPNPVTAGIAVVTGVVWAGTEVWDHWDEITDFAGAAWDKAGDAMDWVYHNVPVSPLIPVPAADLVEGAGKVWDAGVEMMDNVAETVVDGVGDIAGGIVDGAGDLASGAMSKIGGLFG